MKHDFSKLKLRQLDVTLARWRSADLSSRPPSGWLKAIRDEIFVRQLHRQMFGETWRWAGEFRKSDKNIGVDRLRISVELRNLLDDVRYQIEHATYQPDETAVRFHHRMVAIHLFPTGNCRHARLIADMLAERLGRPRFTWGIRNLVDVSETRQRYIAALQAADSRDYAPLMAFARS